MGIFAKIEIAPHMTDHPPRYHAFCLPSLDQLNSGVYELKALPCTRLLGPYITRVWKFIILSQAEPLNLTNCSSISRRNRVEDESRLSLYTASTRRRLLHERIRRKQLLPDDSRASTSISGCTDTVENFTRKTFFDLALFASIKTPVKKIALHTSGFLIDGHIC